MKAIRVHETGSIDRLALEEIAAPTPEEGELRLKVHACGINFADLLMVQGRYQEKPSLPFTPGIEVAGEVAETGKAASRFAPGTRVLAILPRGGLAEEAVVAETLAMPIPDGVDDVTAAAFPVAYGTSHLALTHRAGLQAGENLLVLGAAGGVGLTAVEIGKRLGARVIAAASSPEKLEIARGRGADDLVDYSREDLRERVKSLTGGRGANVAFDPVGGAAFEAALRTLDFEGRLIVIGFASGEIGQVPANLLLVKNISVLGLYWGSYGWKRPEVLMASMRELLGWLAHGEIAPHISAVYPLAEAARAMEDLAARRSTGKVVVRID